MRDARFSCSAHRRSEIAKENRATLLDGWRAFEACLEIAPRKRNGGDRKQKDNKSAYERSQGLCHQDALGANDKLVIFLLLYPENP